MGVIAKIKAKATDLFVEHAPSVAKAAVDAVGFVQDLTPVENIAQVVNPLVVPVLDHVLPKAGPYVRIPVWLGTDASLVPNALSRPPLKAIKEASPLSNPREPGVSPATTGNEITNLVDGPAYKAALLEQIKSAKTSIWIETYQWQDWGGDEIANALIAAKKENPKLEIRVLYDNRSNFAQLQQAVKSSDPPPKCVAAMAAAGIDVRRTEYSALRVNHRKVSVFDGETTFVGGQNIGNSYFLDSGYHDMTQRLRGPAAYDAGKVFADSWYRAGGDKLTVPPRPAKREGFGSGAQVQVVMHSGGLDRNIEREQIQRIDGETKEVVLLNGFGMSDEIKKALLRARERGVKVTWLWGHASEMATFMAQESFEELSKHGVEVRKHPQHLHMKAMYFRSGDAMLQGSSNLDGASTMINDEAILQIHGGGVAQNFYDTVVAPDIKKSPRTYGKVQAYANKTDELKYRTLERIVDGD